MALTSCRFCAAPVSTLAERCPTCLSAFPSSRGSSRSWRGLLLWAGISVLFVATWSIWIPLALRSTDSMTNVPLTKGGDRRLPVVVMSGGRARVSIQPHRAIPPPFPGESYLIPVDKTADIEAQIRSQQDPSKDGNWKLRVRQIAPGRQHIELYWMDDGYSGAAYEATATSVRPLYWKITGPGYGIVVAGVAFLVNVVGWSLSYALIRVATQAECPPNSALHRTGSGSAVRRESVTIRRAAPRQ